MQTKQNHAKLALKSIVVLAVAVVLLTLGGLKAQAATLSKVTGLQQTSAYTSSIYMSWDAVAGDNVRYEVSSTSSTGSTTTYTAYSSSGYISGLNAGSSYYIKVRAYTTSGDYGEYSSQVEMVTTPSAPSSVKQTKATKSSVSLSWTGSSSGVTGYHVRTYSSGSTNLAEVTSTSATISASAGSYDYYYVYAYKKSASGYVAESSYAYSVAYAAPGKPQYLASSKYGYLTWHPTKSNKVTVCWNKNSSDEYTPSGYQIQVYDVTGKTRLKTYNITNQYTTQKAFNLSKVKNKGFQIRARAYVTVNGTKYYGSWTSKTVVIPEAKISLTRPSKTSLKVSWTKVTNATSYTIYYCKNVNASSPKWKKAKTVTKSVTSYTVKGLTTGKYAGIYVIPTVKVNGKKYKASATWYLSVYMSKY